MKDSMKMRSSKHNFEFLVSDKELEITLLRETKCTQVQLLMRWQLTVNELQETFMGHNMFLCGRLYQLRAYRQLHK